VSIWDTSRKLLASSVVNHLGEGLSLTEAGGGAGVATVRGVLVRPEEYARLGVTHAVAADSMLTLRVGDAPAWLGRGVMVTSDRGDTYRVTGVRDNGETLLEVTLCRLS